MDQACCQCKVTSGREVRACTGTREGQHSTAIMSQRVVQAFYLIGSRHAAHAWPVTGKIESRPIDIYKGAFLRI